MDRTREAPALAGLSRICLGLPQAERRNESRHASFRVRGRAFAWYLVDHHGDGMISLNVKAAPGDNAALLRLDSYRLVAPGRLAAAVAARRES